MNEKRKQSRLSNLFLGFALGMYLGPKLVKKLKQTELTAVSYTHLRAHEKIR